MTDCPPIYPETLLDMIQAAGAHTSDLEGQREFGKALLRFYFEEFPSRYADDTRARGYLTEVLACAASAIRGFSVERTAFKAARAREERLEQLRATLLGRVVMYSPLEGEKARIAYALLAKALGISLGVVPQFFIPPTAPGWVAFGLRVALFALAIAGLLFGDLVATIVTLRLQQWGYRKTGQDVQGVWLKSFPRYKALSVDFLIAAERIRERYYPGTVALVPGVEWSKIAPGELLDFVWRPLPELSDKRPADVLSRVVDMHFSLDRSVPQRYVPPS